MEMILLIGSTSFFVNIGASLAKNIPVSDKEPSEYMTHDILEMFHLSPVAEAEIDKIISNFKDSAAGWGWAQAFYH